MSLSVLCVNKSKIRMPRKFLLDWVSACQRELRRTGRPVGKGSRSPRSSHDLRGELVIVFMDPTPARKLNLEYRQRDYATDVLSFESLDGGMGDLVLCPQVIQRQAIEHRLSFREELGYMILHGILHLLGYDHEQGGEPADQMYDLQDRIFERLRS